MTAGAHIHLNTLRTIYSYLPAKSKTKHKGNESLTFCGIDWLGLFDRTRRNRNA